MCKMSSEPITVSKSFHPKDGELLLQATVDS